MFLSDLFDNKEKWIKKSLVQDINGNDLIDGDCKDERAASWCLLGGIFKVSEDFDTQRQLMDKTSSIIRELFPDRAVPFCTISYFNNHERTTFEDIRKIVEHSDLQI